MIEPEIKQIRNETKEEMKKISQQKKRRLSTALIIKIPARKFILQFSQYCSWSSKVWKDPFNHSGNH